MLLAQSMLMAAGASQSTQARWNPSDRDSDIVLSNSNRTMAATGSGTTSGSVRATLGKSSGSWFFEATIASNLNSPGAGIGTLLDSLAGSVGQDAYAYGYESNGDVRHNNIVAATLASFGAGAVIGVAFDLNLLRLWFAKDGVWQNGDPALRSGGLAISAATYYPMAYSGHSSSAWTIPLVPAYAPSGFAVI